MSENSDERSYPQRPIVGVGGVIFDGDNVLLIKRAKPPSIGVWSLPGGAQELGETLEKALKREIAEETGLDIRLGGLVDVVDFIDQGENGNPRHHYSLVDYWGTAHGEPRASSDVSEARWVPMRDLASYDLWEKTQEVILKAHTQNQTPQKHTIKGHLRTILYAVIIGLGAYGVLWVLMIVLRAIGFQEF